ncbi:MAG: TatD family hydrolase [Rikenellaceae bacterium]
MSKISPYINIHTHKKVPGEISITTIGVHPYDAESGIELPAEKISPEIQAIGEIGLDFSRDIDRGAQEKLFTQQLSLAEHLQLPVVIHTARSMERSLEILNGFTLKAVIIHGFIGSVQQAQTAIGRGYFLSFGHRCFASPKTLTALSDSPLESIFLETDDFDISIEKIYEQAAAYRTESLDEIRNELYKNYTKIFKQQRHFG